MSSLKRQFRTLRKEASSARDFKHALWSELSLTIDKDFRPEGRRVHWRLATVPMAVLVLMFMMGTGVYAYESPSVSEGHPLFGVKRGMEEVQRAFIGGVQGPEARVKFEAHMEERRIQELEHTSQRLPIEVQQQIKEIHATIEAGDKTEMEKRQMFHSEVKALLQQNGVEDLGRPRGGDRPDHKGPRSGGLPEGNIDTDVNAQIEISP